MFYMHKRRACRIVRMIDGKRAEIQYLTSGRICEVNFGDMKAPTEPPTVPAPSRQQRIWEAHVRRRVS